MSLVRRQTAEARDTGALDADDLDRFFHHPEHESWAQPLFTGLSATVFLILMAAVAAAAILYSQGAMIPGPKI